MKKITVIIADDHEMIAETLGKMIGDQEDFELLGNAFNGKQVVEMLEKQQPDVLVLDIEMPEMDGIATMRHIAANFPKMKVLALSNYNDPPTVRKMIQEGIRGYILKNRSGKFLVNGIRTVAKGGTAFDDRIKDTFIDSFSMRVVDGEEHEQVTLKVEILTEREIELLKLLSDELTAKDIAEKMFIEKNTVNSHKQKIMEKLNLANEKLLVRFAVEQGLVDALS
jgi:DNA-binding NarL/FixJ family response regulator